MLDHLLRLSHWLIERRRRTIAVGVLVMLSCLPAAIVLYADLRSSIEELLPRSAPSVKAIDVLHTRLGDNLQLAMYVSGAPAPRLHEFADRLAEQVLQLRHGAPRLVDYKPRNLQEFFSRRRLLFAKTGDLAELEQRIDARIAWEKKKANPFSLGLEEQEPAPTFDDIVARYEKVTDLLRVYPSGYYDGPDGQSLAMIFYASRGMTGYHASLAFRDRIHDMAKRTAAVLGMPQLRFEFTGDIETVIQEQKSLVSDLMTSSVLVLVLVLALLLAYFRWWPCMITLGLPLATGTLATFALAQWAIGSLNASTAFLGSIIVGNGINPGIILLARYLEERRRGLAQALAMDEALRGTALATGVASAAASLSYAALMITTFRGYSHFGFIGGVGMVLCWLATYLLVPPLMLAVERRWPLPQGPRLGEQLDRLFAGIGGVAVRALRPIFLVTVLLTLVAGVGLGQLAGDPIDHDTTRLRSARAKEPGGTLEVDRKVDRILQRFLTPVVVLCAARADVEPLAEAYRTMIASPGKHLIGTVLTLQSLVPPEQQAKAEIINRLRAKLNPARVARLDPRSRDLVRRWLPGFELQPFTARDLPEEVRRQFRETDGSEGRLVLLFPKHGTQTRDGRVVRALAHEARSVQLPRGAVVAGSYLVFADMFESITRDGPMATLVALAAVFFLTLVLSRGAGGSFAVTLSLILGVAWTVGLVSLTGERFNFLNFIALPITFGIGVDYATNIYGRFRLGAATRENLVNAVSHSGAAVAICSGTTVIGYSSLLLSKNGALFSFGALSVIGEIICLGTALFVLPMLLAWRLSR